MYALASYQGLYSQIIVVLTLEDSALKTSIHKQKRYLQEDLDVIDIIKFRILRRK